MSNLVDHIERYLGRIQHGWKSDPDGLPAPFQIVECRNGVMKDVVSFVTLGLSEYGLLGGRNGSQIRQELVWMSRPASYTTGIPAILQQIGIEALQRETAYLRGDVIGPRGPLFGREDLQSLYVSIPVYLPSEFAVALDSFDQSVVFAWVFPITQSEASVVSRMGWNRFEDLLQLHNPDLLDATRASVK